MSFLKSTMNQDRDAGLALVLICLLITYFANISAGLSWAIIVLLIVMVWPPFFKPWAWFWFGLSTILGMMTSRIFLTILFFGMIFPIGLVRRLGGADAFKLKIFKTGDDSVFIIREHQFTPADLEHPY